MRGEGTHLLQQGVAVVDEGQVLEPVDPDGDVDCKQNTAVIACSYLCWPTIYMLSASAGAAFEAHDARVMRQSSHLPTKKPATSTMERATIVVRVCSGSNRSQSTSRGYTQMANRAQTGSSEMAHKSCYRWERVGHLGCLGDGDDGADEQAEALRHQHQQQHGKQRGEVCAC